MTVYNNTTKLNWAISADWLEWQQQEAIPEAMATRLFEEYKIYRLMEPDDGEGPTFVIQYFSSSPGHCQLYMREHAAIAIQKASAKWGDQFVSFQTILQAVS